MGRVDIEGGLSLCKVRERSDLGERLFDETEVRGKGGKF
jgi:hypothetical protein